ncbi:reverse transcriptase domain-containing protein [Tanacetum coccineum]
MIEDHQVRRIIVDGRSSAEIMYEHCFRNLCVNIRSRLRRCRAPLIGFLGETYHPLGIIDLRVTLGDAERNKTVLMEFAIVKYRSPYNVIIGRTGMRILRAVGSTIHSMIKFLTNQGIVTMETSRESLWECKQLEKVHGSGKEVQWRQREEKMSRIREQAILRTKSCFVHGPNQDVFAWVGLEETVVSRFFMEHQLKIYLLAKPVVYKRRPMTSEGRQALKEKVEVDYSSLNKVCAKDIYPFPEEGEGLKSWMKYPYKCFLRLPKENNQIRMAENDIEKTGFYMEEEVYCFTHMPKGLKNSVATLQRMMEKVLANQKGRNMEVYLEEIVVKSKSEQSLIQDVEETLRKLNRVNIKIDPNTSSFGVKEGRFLGHVVTKEGVRADLNKVLKSSEALPQKV